MSLNRGPVAVIVSRLTVTPTGRPAVHRTNTGVYMQGTHGDEHEKFEENSHNALLIVSLRQSGSKRSMQCQQFHAGVHSYTGMDIPLTPRRGALMTRLRMPHVRAVSTIACAPAGDEPRLSYLKNEYHLRDQVVGDVNGPGGVRNTMCTAVTPVVSLAA